ncbi:MAG TPA: hypothetical protein VKY85_28055 [Candidatus Angelobacter sp.]|nr:hypothetical protein [Candidatus Angelobacter sp.]
MKDQPKQQRRERKYYYEVYSAYSKVEEHLQHPYDNHRLKDCPKHRCTALMHLSVHAG